MPRIWTYSDTGDRGYGLFKRRIFQELHKENWATGLAEAPLLEPKSKDILRQRLLDYSPDWIFLINQSAEQLYEYLNIPANQRPLSCKKIVWYLDNPRFFIQQPFEPTEYVFCFDETYLHWLEPFCSHPPRFLSLASDQFQPGKFNPKFACDVSFVGGVIDQSKRRGQLSLEMVGYIQRLVEEKLKNRSKTFEELARIHPIAEGKVININADVSHYLYWEANNLYRIRTLEALQDYNLKIYGNEDWELLLQGSPLFNRFHGRVDPKTELPDIFVSSKINLNIHSIQCLGSLNQRDFNAPVCGGFLLSDWVPAAGKYFVPGKEAVFYSGEINLLRKIDYYLEHEEEKAEIIRAGKQCVLDKHTYTNRVEYLLERLPL